MNKFNKLYNNILIEKIDFKDLRKTEKWVSSKIKKLKTVPTAELDLSGSTVKTIKPGLDPHNTTRIDFWGMDADDIKKYIKEFEKAGINVPNINDWEKLSYKNGEFRYYIETEDIFNLNSDEILKN